ncbi:MAG TPA: glycoside hydrolase family 15 protein [Solirubrobacterales bacterium]|nr:glycoside hydrolase family 15 protein [Solirubrobacterales bacterium]
MSTDERSASPEACQTGFPRIGSYGFLSDCETGALMAANGSIEWMCLPRFDSPSIFGALLDRAAGAMRFAPDERVPVARRYEPGTNVIETTWATETGWVIVRDALIVNAVRSHDGRNRLEAERMLIRWAHCPEGHTEIELVCDAFPDYGRGRIDWDLDAELGVATAVVGDVPLRLQADIDLEVEDGRIWGVGRLDTDENAFCVLTWSDEARLPGHAGEAARQIYETGQAWRRWLERGKFPDHRWRGELQRSALTLKGLMYAPTGGMVAALTTSLPETPGGERNWDYRYTWIRDATFALWGLHVLGLDSEATDFMDFVEKVTADSDGHLQIMYGIGGEKELTESTLDHLHGYLGSRPVRIGNAAYAQRQNDVYGALLDSIYIHSRALGGVSDGLWKIAVQQVEAAISVWEQPDQGIWEARGEPKHYLSSKLMCWVALDRGTRCAKARGERERAERWGAEADRIKADILDRGVRPDGVFRQHYETDHLDASTLLVPLVRFLPPDDERVVATVETIAEDLTEMGLVLRYRTEHTDDGLSGVEGTFTICSFWLVSALAEIGEHERAAGLCEHLLMMGGALDLYAEEIEPHTGRQLGNFPQAFTHLALINAVSQVVADEMADGREPDERAVFSEMLAARGDGRIEE